MKPIDRIKDKLLELTSLDLRSMALMRICTGILIVSDLIVRLTDLRAHYTDLGVLPLDVLYGIRGDEGSFSLHRLSGDTSYQLLLFIVALFLAAMLIIGYRTRLVTFLCWIMMVSLHNRHPLLLQGGDTYFRLLLFWANFLPWGEYFSIDYLRNQKKFTNDIRYLDKKNLFRFSSPAALAFMVQLGSVYVFSALLKTGAEWRTTFDAIYYTLSIDQFATSWGKLLLEIRWLLRPMTFMTYLLELLGPFLYLLPFGTQYVRLGIVGAFISFHIGLALTMMLGHFPWVMIAGWLALLPALFWDSSLPWLKGKTVLLLQRISVKPKNLRASSNIDQVGKYLSESYTEWDSPVRYKLDVIWDILKPLRVYLTTTLILLLMATAFLWNVNTLRTSSEKVTFPPLVRSAVRMIRLDQYWNMFAPYPLKDDGWYVIVGKWNSSGREVDLFAGSEGVSWAKPEDVANTYPNQRWRKYMMNLWAKRFDVYRDSYLAYLCRESELKYGSKVDLIDMYFVVERTLPNYAVPNSNRNFLVRYDCTENKRANL